MTIASCSVAAAAPGKTRSRSGDRNKRSAEDESGAGWEGASTSAMSTTESE